MAARGSKQTDVNSFVKGILSHRGVFKHVVSTMKLVFLLATFSTALAFTPNPFSHHVPSHISALHLSSPNYNDPQQPPSRSRFAGMQRDPTEQELAIMDDMITKLSNAKPYELPNAVSRAIRVVSSPRFFLRIAERADKETDPSEKAKLSALADNLVTTIQAVVSMTEENLDERAKDVEKVVKAASEPESGEFLVPLSRERVDAMREVLEGLDEEDLNEGFLSTIDAWMNKAHQVSWIVLFVQGIFWKCREKLCANTTVLKYLLAYAFFLRNANKQINKQIQLNHHITILKYRTNKQWTNQ